ncbi:MAG: transketolase C-terminal domain-containing protein [Candidatus Brocadiia bacterium]
MREVISGNHCVSYGAMLSRAQVISAYPITPQTQIVEMLSEFCRTGRLNAKFIKVESEHSAMAACIGASLTGARAFTATSGQGLLLMHELIHWAANARLPIVMADVNRSIGPGWNIWTEQNDSLSQRDTGWMQIYCESNQEVIDTVIQAFRIAEKVYLPVMVVLDAFVLSHTSEPVDVPDQKKVDRFLPSYKPAFQLDINKPSSFGGLTTPDFNMEFKYQIEQAIQNGLEVAKQVDRDFGRAFGRSYGIIEAYRCDGADIILLTSATITSTSRDVVDELRKKGEKVGLLKVRLFRPFPAKAINAVLTKTKKVAVIDRNNSFGVGGIFCQELKAAMCNTPRKPQIYSYVVGMGGRDVTPDTIKDIYYQTKKAKTPADRSIWVGLKKELV